MYNNVWYYFNASYHYYRPYQSWACCAKINKKSPESTPCELSDFVNYFFMKIFFTDMPWFTVGRPGISLVNKFKIMHFSVEKILWSRNLSRSDCEYKPLAAKDEGFWHLQVTFVTGFIILGAIDFIGLGINLCHVSLKRYFEGIRELQFVCITDFVKIHVRGETK